MKMLRYKILFSLVILAGWSASTFAKMNVGGKAAHAPVRNTKIAASCPVTSSQIDLDINQVRARVLVGGDLWWDPVGQVPYYEVPIGSGKNAIYSGALWIGGFDQAGQLKVAAQTYRQGGSNDFWGGPIDTASGTASIDNATCDAYDRFWSISRKEVSEFVAGGEATNSIKTWPGNGDFTKGELPTLAPFFDADNDGVYNYENGDYPYFLLAGDYPANPNTGKVECNDYLFGDKSIWWVFNDVGNIKTESTSNPIGLEIRAQAFAFKTANEINLMTFYKYQIINRSSDELDSTYFGVWCDPDLGNAADDLVGCDVGLGLGYVYNGDPDDDGGPGYGLNPPAAGIDFFQGPLADPNDGIDNNRDGEIDEAGEQIIMSRFVYYVNTNNVPNGNPNTTDDYYEYLSGSWLDGLPITYGGDGRGAGSGATATPCNFMFPDNTDPDFSTPWTMVTANIQPDDMRWLQSAGTFTLQPGAVNYITTGVIFQRTTAGGPLASVSLLKLADQKAQAIFDNCFKILDGPDAPNLAIREDDKKLILSLENVANKKVELYNEVDAVIPKAVQNATGGFDTLTDAERSYTFQGYKIYQVADETISDADVNDLSKAKLIAQVDLKDNIGQIVNYEYDNNISAWVPSEKTTVVNNGLQHSFIITKDLFSQKDLVNYKPYYFLVVSYAYNNYRPFDPLNANTQNRPYVQGRNNIGTYSGIPHKSIVNNAGSVLNSAYGTGVQVKRIEGQGNGGNFLDMTQASVDEIFSSPTNSVQNPVYEVGKGPINVSVYDPWAVKAGSFELAFSGVSDADYYYLYNNPSQYVGINDITVNGTTVTVITSGNSGITVGTYITLSNVQGITSTPSINGSFEVEYANADTLRITTTSFSGTLTAGTNAQLRSSLARSTFSISSINEQLYEKNKISMAISKINGQEPGNFGATNNGLIGGTKTYKNASDQWLGGVKDVDATSILTSTTNWILSGTQTNVDLLNPSPSYFLDSIEAYESILEGTWAPFIVASNAKTVAAPKPSRTPGTGNSLDLRSFIKWNYIPSVDVVITSDKSKWTRSVVMEMGEDTMPTIGNAKKFMMRNQHSVDKNGLAWDAPGANVSEASLTDTVGMGWFPGYAVNVETGERLNIAFGENSALLNENGTDMKWNPTSNSGRDSNGRLSYGGMHYIYVYGIDTIASTGISPTVGKYDNGVKIDTLFRRFSNAYTATASAPSARAAFRAITWCTLPFVNDGFNYNENTSSDVKVSLRVQRNYKKFTSEGATQVNGGNPYYQFTIPGSYELTTNVTEKAKSALDYINVVPNPYYAYSTYEKTRRDQLENRVRIVNLPSRCTVSIYTLNGTLVRQFKRDISSDVTSGQIVTEGRDNNQATTLDWDLKNTAGITVSSGVYIFHVDAGELGEKVVKWFGVMRPIDLDSF